MTENVDSTLAFEAQSVQAKAVQNRSKFRRGGESITETRQRLKAQANDQEIQRRIGEDAVFFRRVLSRLPLYHSVSGHLTIEATSAPDRIVCRDTDGQMIGHIDVTSMNAIIREESLRARDYASKIQGG